MPRTKMLKLTMFAGVLLTSLLVIGSAQASVYVMPSPYSGNFTLNSDGTVSPQFSSTEYTDIVQQDKDWSSFAGNLPAGTVFSLGLAVVGGKDIHRITFLLQTSTSYNISYDISVLPSSTRNLLNVSSGLVQTTGTSDLTTTLVDNFSNTYTTNFTVTGSTVSGTTSATFSPKVTSLTVADVLTVSAGGSDVSAVSNSFTQTTPTPEPASLALFGSGILGVAGLLRRKNTL